MPKLPRKLKNKPFTVQQAALAGLSFYELSKLVASGAVEQVARGIYRPSGEDISEEDQFRIATLRIGSPSAICLISALSFHHLTDTIPKKTWVLVPDNKRTSDKNLKLFRSRNPQWKLGIEKNDGYSVTNIERTIIECLAHRSRLGTQIGVEALRRAINQKKTDLNKIMQMASQLKLSHRILPYVEALA